MGGRRRVMAYSMMTIQLCRKCGGCWTCRLSKTLLQRTFLLSSPATARSMVAHVAVDFSHEAAVPMEGFHEYSCMAVEHDCSLLGLVGQNLPFGQHTKVRQVAAQ